MKVKKFNTLCLNDNKTLWIFAISILLCCHSLKSHAAYCSLRDTVTAINKSYPSASHHISITREVNREHRNIIAQRLPFTLLFNELGKHTLYAVMKEKTTLGFIHSRSELTDSGLIEIVWAINPDLTIKDNYFQRCRTRKSRDPIFMEEMKKNVKGKSFQQLLLTRQSSFSFIMLK